MGANPARLVGGVLVITAILAGHGERALAGPWKKVGRGVSAITSQQQSSPRIFCSPSIGGCTTVGRPLFRPRATNIIIQPTTVYCPPTLPTTTELFTSATAYNYSAAPGVPVQPNMNQYVFAPSFQTGGPATLPKSTAETYGFTSRPIIGGGMASNQAPIAPVTSRRASLRALDPDFQARAPMTDSASVPSQAASRVQWQTPPVQTPIAAAQMAQQTQSVEQAKVLGVALGRGDKAFERGQFDEARAEYSRALIVGGEDAGARIAMGVAAFAQGQYLDASEAIREGLAVLGTLSPEMLDLRKMYGQSEQLAVHVAALEQHATARPADAEARFLLGFVKYYSGDRSAGTKTLQEYAGMSGFDEGLREFMEGTK